MKQEKDLLFKDDSGDDIFIPWDKVVKVTFRVYEGKNFAYVRTVDQTVTCLTGSAALRLESLLKNPENAVNLD